MTREERLAQMEANLERLEQGMAKALERIIRRFMAFARKNKERNRLFARVQKLWAQVCDIDGADLAPPARDDRKRPRLPRPDNN